MSRVSRRRKFVTQKTFPIVHYETAKASSELFIIIFENLGRTGWEPEEWRRAKRQRHYLDLKRKTKEMMEIIQPNFSLQRTPYQIIK